jgi:ATP/maltotriose-dependent transcriptional regulator MalT
MTARDYPAARRDLAATLRLAGEHGFDHVVVQCRTLDDALLPLVLPSLLSIEEIAEDLSISVNTVKSHLRAVYLKLGVGGRRAAAVATHERELVRTGRYMAR